MFQDHIQKGLQKVVGGSSGQDVSADVEDAEDWKFTKVTTPSFGKLFTGSDLLFGGSCNECIVFLELCRKSRRI